jgi:hypothetical protein
MKATPQPNEPKSRAGRYRTPWAIKALLITFVILLLLTIYFGFRLPNRVRIAVTNIPTGTRYASLVAEADGELKNMFWLVPSPFLAVPSAMHPAKCVWSDQSSEGPPRVDWDAFVQWEWGTRYGVVTRSETRIWHVTWFTADQVAICGRVPVFGGATAAFDLSQGQKELLPAEAVNKLGLRDVRLD